MKQIFILTIYLSSFINCQSQNCNTLPKHFASYEAALQLIDFAKFDFRDDVNTSRSSWLKEAKYLSCHSQKGFFIIRTKKNDVYIHQDLPVEIWYQFKKTNSFGQFYAKQIRGKYRLNLN